MTYLAHTPFKAPANMPTQHIATLLGATCCVRLTPVLRYVATCWVLLAQIWPVSNLSQQHPTCCNTVAKHTQHVAPNNVSICCVDMLQSHVVIVWLGLKLIVKRVSFFFFIYFNLEVRISMQCTNMQFLLCCLHLVFWVLINNTQLKKNSFS